MQLLTDPKNKTKKEKICCIFPGTSPPPPYKSSWSLNMVHKV